MPNPRPSAWALIGVLVASIGFSVGPVSAAEQANQPLAQDSSMCNYGQPTKWKDEFHPPDTVRVLRSRGPTAGKVDVVPLFKYVGRVVRAEYSSGSSKPYPWMEVGALTVKQYAWYYAMHWRGGKIPVYKDDGTGTGTMILDGYSCYDLKDTTADQIYTDLKKNTTTGEWIEANVPSAANIKAMHETWHLSLRKWKGTKNISWLFLTGYRSGFRKPCGSDSTGFKIYQKSLRDCGAKNLTLEETIREYFEPNIYIVDTRGNDVLDDNMWRGELGLLASASGGSSTAARLYASNGTGLDPAVVDTFSVNFGSIVGQGSGNVDGADSTGTTSSDTRMFSDLVMLTSSGSLLVAKSRGNGTGYGDPVANPVAPPAADSLIVGDFNGDLLADAGLLKTTGNTTTLKVMRRSADGSQFNDAVEWWSGDLSGAVFVAAGDVNGDGKADLITRDSSGAFATALSPASCSDLTIWGPCPTAAIGAQGLGQLNPALGAGAAPAADAKVVVGDYDRDGREDVVAVTNNGGSGIKVWGMRGRTDGTFADPTLMATVNGVSWGTNGADLMVAAFDANPDGMADLALIQKDGTGSKLTWLRSVEKTGTVGPTMVPTSPLTDGVLPWSTANRLY